MVIEMIEGELLYFNENFLRVGFCFYFYFFEIKGSK